MTHLRVGISWTVRERYVCVISCLRESQYIWNDLGRLRFSPWDLHFAWSTQTVAGLGPQEKNTGELITLHSDKDPRSAFGKPVVTYQRQKQNSKWRAAWKGYSLSCGSCDCLTCTPSWTEAEQTISILTLPNWHTQLFDFKHWLLAKFVYVFV